MMNLMMMVGKMVGGCNWLQEAPNSYKQFQTASEGSSRLQEAPEAQEAPGGPRRLEEAPGGHRRPQEAHGGPQRLAEADRGSHMLTEVNRVRKSLIRRQMVPRRRGRLNWCLVCVHKSSNLTALYSVFVECVAKH